MCGSADGPADRVRLPGGPGQVGSGNKYSNLDYNCYKDIIENLVPQDKQELGQVKVRLGGWGRIGRVGSVQVKSRIRKVGFQCLAHGQPYGNYLTSSESSGMENM